MSRKNSARCIALAAGLVVTAANAATYDIPIWRTVRPWIKFELYNIFDNNKLINWNISVNPDPNSPLDADGLEALDHSIEVSVSSPSRIRPTSS